MMLWSVTITALVATTKGARHQANGPNEKVRGLHQLLTTVPAPQTPETQMDTHTQKGSEHDERPR